MTRKYEYDGEQLDWLAQWIIVELKHSPQYHSVQSIKRQFDNFDAVTEKKVRYRLKKLERAGLVTVEEHQVAKNINPKKLYLLSEDGAGYVNNMSDKLAKPPQLRNQDKLEYLMDQTDAQEHYIKELMEYAIERDVDIDPWSEN